LNDIIAVDALFILITELLSLSSILIDGFKLPNNSSSSSRVSVFFTSSNTTGTSRAKPGESVNLGDPGLNSYFFFGFVTLSGFIIISARFIDPLFNVGSFYFFLLLFPFYIFLSKPPKGSYSTASLRGPFSYGDSEISAIEFLLASKSSAKPI
jgi:hypothetical protein